MALNLVSDLLNDDDENVECWYVAGVAAMNIVPFDAETARYHITTAMTMMDEIRRHCGEIGEPFPYDEEYGLLEDHMRGISDLEADDSVPKVDADMEVDNDI